MEKGWWVIDRTANEDAYIAQIRDKIDALQRMLNERSLPDDNAAPIVWHAYLAEMKKISGHGNNDLTFVAGLMAKEYLYRRFSMRPFDAALKPMGATGLDIDERTVDGQRIVGGVKTTTPDKNGKVQANQRLSFLKDFAKLAATDADHKFFFVTDPTTFRVVVDRNVNDLSGVTVVQLTTGEIRTIPRESARSDEPEGELADNIHPCP